MTRLLVVAVTALLTAGCSGSTEVRGERVDTAAVEQAATAVLHTVAADLVARPEVVCAEASTSDDGVPTRPATDVFLTLVTTGADPAQREALALDAGRRLWLSPAPQVGRVGVLVVEDGGAEGSGTGLAALLGGTGRSATGPELEARFGPRPTPPVPASPLPDPGEPSCP